MDINFDSRISKTIQMPLTDLTNQLVKTFAGNLKSVCVTGSSLTEDFIPGKSGINTVIVFGQESIDVYDTISGFGKMLYKNRFDMPLIMTDEHIRRSQDVFGVEYLDFQLNHAILFGDDPFAALTFNKADVRLQCERELKADLIRLRQGYIASKIGTAKLRDVLVGCSRALLPYLRAMLWMCEQPRSAAVTATIDDAAKQFDFDGEMLKTIAGWKYAKARPAELELREASAYLYNLTNTLAIWVDKYNV